MHTYCYTAYPQYTPTDKFEIFHTVGCDTLDSPHSPQVHSNKHSDKEDGYSLYIRVSSLHGFIMDLVKFNNIRIFRYF